MLEIKIYMFKDLQLSLSKGLCEAELIHLFQSMAKVNIYFDAMSQDQQTDANDKLNDPETESYDDCWSTEDEDDWVHASS